MTPAEERDTQGERYCLRRANPFLGLVAVVKTSAGRALSPDGRIWQLQVLAHPPRGLWSGEGHEDRLQYFRFGLWSERTGLRRVPLNPILDAGRMVAALDALIGLIQGSIDELPFPLAEELELWLLDRAQVPLALLATAIPGSALGEMGTPSWSVGATSDRPFVSATLRCRDAARTESSSPLRHATVLERLVESTAGRHLNRQWFRREGDGTGVGLDYRAPNGLSGRRLPAGAFPRLPLRTDWSEEIDRDLVSDWLDWIAPYLLTLPEIDDRLRGRLEQEAVQEPKLVDDLWPLYPRVLDRDLMTRARVEARLLRATS